MKKQQDVSIVINHKYMVLSNHYYIQIEWCLNIYPYIHTEPTILNYLLVIVFDIYIILCICHIEIPTSRLDVMMRVFSIELVVQIML